MKLDDFAPLHEGTTATIRSNSPVGHREPLRRAAARARTRAPRSRTAARSASTTSTAPVDLDQLFNTLDEPTRAALQKFVKGSAQQIDGKSAQGAESLKYLSPALSTSSALVNEIVADKLTFQRFVTDTSRVVEAVAERRSDLSGLVSNANTTADAIGDENVALARTLDVLPDTLRNANTTFVNLRSTLDDLDVLVNESKPATRRLAPFLRALRPLVSDARPTIRDLRTLIRAPGDGNDLIELTSKAPRLQSLSSRVFPRSVEALRRTQPVIEYIRPYSPDLTGWFTKFGQGAANYDANGHYARIQPVFNAFSLSAVPGGEVLTATRPSQRLEGFEFKQNERCPGGATQPPPDDSAPWQDPNANVDCDPTTTPPGP